MTMNQVGSDLETNVAQTMALNEKRKRKKTLTKKVSTKKVIISTMALPRGDLIAQFLKGQCYDACNPSAFMQRIVAGARKKEQSMHLVQTHKDACIKGCDLAATAPDNFDDNERKALLEAISLSSQSAAKLATVEELDANKSRRRDQATAIRTQCYDSCGEVYNGDEKLHSMCAEGCDSYMESLV